MTTPPASNQPRGNPFTPGRPLTADQRIFGRDDELAQVARHLADHNSINLVAERRLGKTSFLNHLPRFTQAIDPSLLLVPLDFHAEVTDPAHFYGRASRGLLAGLPPTVVLPTSLQGLHDRLATTPEASYAEFEAVLRHLHDTPGPRVWPVLLVDEFEVLREPALQANFPLTFYNGLSSLIGADLLGIVIASRVPLTDHFTEAAWPGSQSSVFPRYFPPLPLPRLDNTASDTLLLQASDHPLSVTEAREARAWARGHPCHLQAAGWAAYEAKARHRATAWASAEREALKRQTCLTDLTTSSTLTRPAGGSVGGGLGGLLKAIFVGLPRRVGRLAQGLGQQLDDVAAWLIGMAILIVLGLVALRLVPWQVVIEFIQRGLGM